MALSSTVASGKQCRRCEVHKSMDEFGRKADTADGFQPWCKPCINENNRQWRLDNLDRERAKGRRQTCAKFRMTPEDYEAMLESQGGGCAICGALAAESDRSFHIDHDHSCCDFSPRTAANPTCGRCTRGILCPKCNLLLGAANDDIDLLVGAIRYVGENRAL